MGEVLERMMAVLLMGLVHEVSLAS